MFPLLFAGLLLASDSGPPRDSPKELPAPGFVGSKRSHKGLLIIAYRPYETEGKSGSQYVGGKWQFFQSWDGPGGKGRRDFSVEGMKLVVDKREYGAVSKQDKIEIYPSKVLVNGKKRDPIPTARTPVPDP